MSILAHTKIAIIGCGAIAESVHIPVAKALDQVQLTAVIDSNASLAKATALKHGVPFHGTSIQEFEGKVDAAIICTPPHIHPMIADQAFKAGLHVLCEKPFANSVLECDEIIAAAEKAGRVLAVTHVFRFWPSRGGIKDIIATKEFGEVKRITVTQGNPYSWQTKTGYNMRPGLVPGGVLFDAGIHPLDTILWWLGRPEILDYEDDSLGGLESNVRLSMRFDKVPLVQFRQSRTAPMSNEFRIETEEATLVLSNYSPTEIRIVQGGKETIRQVGGKETDHRMCEKNQLLDFIESIKQSRAPAVTGETAREVIDLIERCYSTKARRILPSKAPLPGLTISVGG